LIQKNNKFNIIPLQGGNLKNWVDRNYLEGSNVTEFHIYDRDSNSGKNSEQYKNNVMRQGRQENKEKGRNRTSKK